MICEGIYKNGQRFNGSFPEYHLNSKGDNLKTITNYKDGIPDGKWTFYNIDGSLICEGIYKNGQRFNGSFLTYFRNGDIEKRKLQRWSI